MTKAERALLEAALYHWITGRFNHLIVAVHKERERKHKERRSGFTYCPNCPQIILFSGITEAQALKEHRATQCPHEAMSVRVARKRKKR